MLYTGEVRAGERVTVNGRGAVVVGRLGVGAWGWEIRPSGDEIRDWSARVRAFSSTDSVTTRRRDVALANLAVVEARRQTEEARLSAARSLAGPESLAANGWMVLDDSTTPEALLVAAVGLELIASGPLDVHDLPAPPPGKVWRNGVQVSVDGLRVEADELRRLSNRIVSAMRVEEKVRRGRVIARSRLRSGIAREQIRRWYCASLTSEQKTC